MNEDGEQQAMEWLLQLEDARMSKSGDIGRIGEQQAIEWMKKWFSDDVRRVNDGNTPIPPRTPSWDLWSPDAPHLAIEVKKTARIDVPLWVRKAQKMVDQQHQGRTGWIIVHIPRDMRLTNAQPLLISGIEGLQDV